MSMNSINNNLDFDHSILCLGNPEEFEEELSGLQKREVPTSSINDNKNTKAVNKK